MWQKEEEPLFILVPETHENRTILVQKVHLSGMAPFAVEHVSKQVPDKAHISRWKDIQQTKRRKYLLNKQVNNGCLNSWIRTIIYFPVTLICDKVNTIKLYSKLYKVHSIPLLMKNQGNFANEYTDSGFQIDLKMISLVLMTFATDSFANYIFAQYISSNISLFNRQFFAQQYHFLNSDLFTNYR